MHLTSNVQSESECQEGLFLLELSHTSTAVPELEKPNKKRKKSDVPVNTRQINQIKEIGQINNKTTSLSNNPNHPIQKPQAKASSN